MITKKLKSNECVQIIDNCAKNYKKVYTNHGNEYFKNFDLCNFVDMLQMLQITGTNDFDIVNNALINCNNIDILNHIKHVYNKQRFVLPSHKYSDNMYNSNCIVFNFTNCSFIFDACKNTYTDTETGIHIKCTGNYIVDNNNSLYVCNVYVPCFTVPVYKFIICASHAYMSVYNYIIYSKCIDIDSYGAYTGYILKKSAAIKQQIDDLLNQLDFYQF